MSTLLKRALLIKKWRDNPTAFFKEITGNDAWDYQLDVLEWTVDIANNRKLIIVGGTGGGKTYLIALLALWHVICLPPELHKPFRVAIAAGGQAQAKRSYDYVMEFCSRSPILRDWIKGQPLKSEVRFKDNSWIAPIPSSDTQLFNLHCEMFIVDEAAQAGDKVLMHAPRVVGAFNPNRMIVSGHFVDDPKCYISSFVDIWTNDNDFPRIGQTDNPREAWKKVHYSSLKVPWIEQSEIEMARKTYSADEFKTIWEAELPELTSTLFSVAAIRRSRVSEIPVYSGHDPLVMAVDWGFSDSPTGILIAEVVQADDPVDNDYNIIYAEEYPQKTAPWLHKEIDKLIKRFNIQSIRCDSSHSQENYRLRQRGYVVEEMVFRAIKPRMQERLRVLLERDKIKIWRGFDVLLRELVGYRMDLKKDDHLCDCLQMVTWANPKHYMGEFYYVKRKYGQRKR